MGRQSGQDPDCRKQHDAPQDFSVAMEMVERDAERQRSKSRSGNNHGHRNAADAADMLAAEIVGPDHSHDDSLDPHADAPNYPEQGGDGKAGSGLQ
ncbi:hypothetical protein G159_18550 [Planococcus glaciei CHR43]|nr:hypothetical protein G159_18550 [Planococcus glaciei CHR43]